MGTALDARNLSREFKRHLTAAGLPGELRFYDMRHAAASLLIADGLPITVVSAMLGHALTSTTLNNYAHVLPGADRLTAEAMERLLGKVVGAFGRGRENGSRLPMLAVIRTCLTTHGQSKEAIYAFATRCGPPFTEHSVPQYRQFGLSYQGPLGRSVRIRSLLHSGAQEFGQKRALWASFRDVAVG
jgi:hypothetical protein